MSRSYDVMMNVVLAITTRVHRTLHRFSGGRAGRRFPGGATVVWLTVAGRKTGEPRTTPLLATREHALPDAAWVVAGRNAGQSQTPSWVDNVRETGRGELEADGRRYAVAIQEIVEPFAREAAYDRLVSGWRFFEGYAKRTASVRQIPVFRLTPRREL